MKSTDVVKQLMRIDDLFISLLNAQKDTCEAVLYIRLGRLQQEMLHVENVDDLRKMEDSFVERIVRERKKSGRKRGVLFFFWEADVLKLEESQRQVDALLKEVVLRVQLKSLVDWKPLTPMKIEKN